MSKEKQIEEMALDICKSRLVAEDGDACRKCRQHNNCLYQEIAYGLYNAGYRKQSEGEWEKRTFIIFDSEKVAYKCSECNTTWDTTTNFCPNCGAKMKGGAE